MILKAYRAWDANDVETRETVVFAENAREAKKIASETETCEDADYINVRVQRYPQMDEHYRGRPEVDWCDMKDRQALVTLGWTCADTSEECDTCPAKERCWHWVEADDETD